MDKLHEKMYNKCWNECINRSCDDCAAKSILCGAISAPSEFALFVENLHTIFFGEEATANMLGGEK